MLLLVVTSAAAAQTTLPATRPADELLQLNLADGIPLRVLIEYVSQELGINILYDDAQVDDRLTIKAPQRLTRQALLGVLESALRSKGLALADGPQSGWRRVATLAQAARLGDGKNTGEGAVTQVFTLQYAAPDQLSTAIAPFLSGSAATSATVSGQGMLVVTDFAANVERIAQLIARIDQPAQAVGVQFFTVKSADAARLAQQVAQLLKARVRSTGAGERAAAAVETSYDARTNQVVVIAPNEQMEEAKRIVASLDLPVAEQQNPLRFYKLANATATEVLSTIRSLEGESEEDGGSDSRTAPPRPTQGRNNPGGLQRGSNYGPSTSAGETRSSSSSPARMGLSDDRSSTNTLSGQRDATSLDAPVAIRGAGTAADEISSTSRRNADANNPISGVRTRQARVTADPNTNSIIVVGPPDVQRMYEQLIRTLDKRRPQVLIEATIVTLDTSDDFELGVEIGRAGGSSDKRVISFSSFGLSTTANPADGRLTLVPGIGFNGALVSSDIADVILRALSSTTKAKVTSSPRVLVNDNQLGTLSSINGFPFASINASDNVATTSFGDYVRVGTVIGVTPHISESDYLQLEYSVTLSSFIGEPVQQGTAQLPPQLKEDAIESRVTIPDGSTIIVGGLNRRNTTNTKDSIPLLGQIPILEYLFSSRSTKEQNTTLFVFLRPIILRDDQFEDLKFLSDRDVRDAQITGDFPASEPLVIR